MKKLKLKINNLKGKIFEDLIGKKLSILIDTCKPNSCTKESYVGILMGEKDGFLVFNVNLNGKNRIEELRVKMNFILSIWVYSEQECL